MDESIRIRVGCKFGGLAAEWSPAVFQVQPRCGKIQELLEESWQMEPEVARHEYFDLYGNTCQRLTVPSGEFTLRYDAVVRTPFLLDATDINAPELAADDLPDKVLIYTSPSRYCLSDQMATTAYELFGATSPGYRRVQEISEFVHNHLQSLYDKMLEQNICRLIEPYSVVEIERIVRIAVIIVKCHEFVQRKHMG